MGIQGYVLGEPVAWGGRKNQRETVKI